MIIILVIAGVFVLVPFVLFLTLFVENILFLDCLTLSIICSAWISSTTDLHPVFCILCGIGIFACMMLLYVQRYVFWIFTAISTTVWGSMTGYLIHDITDDWLWGIFAGGVACAAVLLLHLHARIRVCG